MRPFRFQEGSTPLLVSCPHVGTHIPGEFAIGMTPAALEVPDTDWHVDRLYDFARDLGAGMLVATYSRYVIDLNRPPDGALLYPGASNTELVPTTRFDFQPIYREGASPDRAAIDRRIGSYWRPYHDQLARELGRLKQTFGYALLWDAHSIRSLVPRFAPERLPDLNLGSGGGSSADPALAERLAALAAEASAFTSVLNGRFKGGYITRAYGKPADGIEAIQLELAQATYMDEAPPWRYRPDLADRVRPVLSRFLETMLAWRPEMKRAAS
ncbi:MAG: N-formylglutamate deformylase [Proteobacteria bacterium]|nr:N-formylglutamate deformylase [Pseudomonadota bacterium]MBI3497621.1 N-formylglutamate deformylase [Pseudomonadota bacterium]